MSYHRLAFIRAFVLLNFLAITLFAIPLSAQDLGLYLESFDHAYSETAPVKRIVLDDMEGDGYEAGKHSFTHNRWELGAKYKQWKAAYLIRYDYYLNYSEDAAELIYADKNDIAIEKDRQYQVWLEAIHARTTGLKLGYEWQANSNFSAALDVSFLQAKSYIDGELGGDFAVLQDDYSGQVSLDYVHDKDRLLKRVVDRSVGYGFATDLRFNWQVDEDWALDFEAIDLFSTLYIDDAPYTQAQATSNRVNFDPDGKIDVKPALTGRIGYRNHRLVFPRQLRLAGEYSMNSEWRFSGQLYRYDDLNFPSLGFTKALSSTLDVESQFEFVSKAVTLRLAGDTWDVQITSDEIKLDEAKTFGLAFSYLYLL